MTNASSSILVVTNDASLLNKAPGHLKRLLPSGVSLKNCTFNEALDQRIEPAPVLVLVDLTEPEEFIFSQLKRIAAHFETSKVVCIGHPSDASLVIEFIKMGVKDFLKLPFEEEELKKLYEQAFDSVDALAPDKKAKKAKILTFYSPKGGTGLTLLTVNLAVTLAKDPKTRVCVCDFSPQCGDVATYLNLVPQYTVRDVIENNSHLDSSFLEGVLLKHASGVRVLPASSQQEDATSFEHLNSMETTLNLLKKSYDFILIDGGHLDPVLLQYAVSESSMIFLVGNPDVVSLKGLAGSFNALKGQKVDAEKIKIVINRYNSKSQIDTKELEKKTKHPIAAQLPNNYTLCIEAVNTGRPLSDIQEKSDLAKKIKELAEMVLKGCGREGASVIDSVLNMMLKRQSPFSSLQQRGR